MKHILQLFTIMFVLAVSSFACDASYPNGIKGDLTTYVRRIEAHYTTKGDLPTPIVANAAMAKYLDAISSNEYHFSPVDTSSAANLIFDMDFYAPNNTYTVQIQVRGMGKTADGHTLFTANGDGNEPEDAVSKGLDDLYKFLHNGWTCH